MTSPMLRPLAILFCVSTPVLLFLPQLFASSIAATLGEGERKTQDIKVR